jgi:hypothetical protein
MEAISRHLLMRRCPHRRSRVSSYFGAATAPLQPTKRGDKTASSGACGYACVDADWRNHNIGDYAQ